MSTDYATQIEAHVSSWLKDKTTDEIAEIKKKMIEGEFPFDEKNDDIKKTLISIGVDYFEIKPDNYYLGKGIYSRCNDDAQLFIEYSRNWSIIFCAANNRFKYMKEIVRLITDNKLLNILEQKKITLDQQDKRYGGRPLHLAISNDNLSIFKLLLENGADIMSYNDQGRTPLEIAKWIGTPKHKKYIKLIKNYIASHLNSDSSDESGEWSSSE